MERRQFIKSSAIAAACTCIGISTMNSCTMLKGVSSTPELNKNAYKYENDLVKIRLDSAPELNKVGSSAKLSVVNKNDKNETKLIVVHRKESEYLVFEDCCTHGGKELNYSHAEKRLLCSSFGHSKFDLKGNIIKGPAKTSLHKYSYNLLAGNVLTIQV